MSDKSKLQELIEGASGTLYWSVDSEKFIVQTASEGFYKILGKNKGTLLEVIYPADVDYFITAVHLLDRTERHTFQHRFISPELKSMNFQTEIWKSKTDNSICGASTPLTNIKATMNEDKMSDIVAKSQEFLDLVIENVPHMVFVKEAVELRFVHFNRAGEELLGIRRDELIGRNDYDFFPKEQADFFTQKDRLVLSGKRLSIFQKKKFQRKMESKLYVLKKFLSSVRTDMLNLSWVFRKISQNGRILRITALKW